MSPQNIDALLDPKGKPDVQRADIGSSPSPRWAWGALLGVLVVIVWAVTYDVSTLSADTRADSSLNSARRSLAVAHRSLTATTSLLASTTATRDARQQALSRTTDQQASVDASLSTVSHAGDLQILDLAALHTCLTGVSSATTAITASNLTAAVTAITTASTACVSLDSSSGGLVYPFDFPDPFVLDAAGQYYAFGTNSVAGNIQILRSSDLIHWTTVGDALPHVASWAQSGATWAPSVLRRGTSFVLYYSALDGSTGDQCISDAVASQPQGPYIDSTQTPLVCQLDQGGSLDPSPYLGADGKLYLTWKSQGGGGSGPTLWAEQMTQKGTALMAGSPSPLLTPSQPWQGGVIEGPDMWVSGATYDLFFAGNNWHTADYAIGMATCTGPLGPCTPAPGQPILSSDPSMSGPGGPDVFTDAEGNLWLAFAAWLPGKVGYPNSRPLFLRRISISGGTVQIGS